MNRLIEIMARLRDPEHGCPWDRAQGFRSIAPYTIEEAHEVADAIERGDLDSLRGELGDLLFQVVFHARMAEEAGAFGFEDVVEAICSKMVRRHPHVFGTARCRDIAEQSESWEAIKADERRAAGGDSDSLMADVARGLPALRRAVKLQKQAARAGFDWDQAVRVLDKIREELDELESEMVAGQAPERLADELGDVLFAVSNLARKLDIDPGSALRRANLKFEQRFRAMENLARARGQQFASLDFDEQERLWHAVKRSESGG